MLALVVNSRLHPRPMRRHHPTSHYSPDRSSLHPDSPRNLCVLSVSALDCSPLGFPLNLQSKIPTRSGLSTLNRLSFLFFPSVFSVPSVVKILSFLISPPATRHFLLSSLLPYFPLCPSRDEILVTATPLDSALTNGDVGKSFRIRSYANCRVGLLSLTKFSEIQEEVFLTKFSENRGTK